MGRVTLRTYIKALEQEHGGLRQAAKAIGIDAGYLCKLKGSRKIHPGDDVLARLGLRHVTTYYAPVKR